MTSAGAGAALVLCAWSTASAAQPPTPAVGQILIQSGSPAELRARLAETSRSGGAADRASAGEAQYFLGTSYERAGAEDSAITCYRRAVDLGGGHRERLALADALLRRRADGDVAAALTLLEPAPLDDEGAHESYQSRSAWAHLLAGRPDTALALFRPLEDRLSQEPEWRFRIARAYLQAGDLRRAISLLVPLAAASRRQDREVMEAIDRIGALSGRGKAIESQIDRAITELDEADGQVVRVLGGQRGAFPAGDGFELGGVVVAPAGKSRARAAVVLRGADRGLAEYDSLAFALRKAGFAVMLMDVRGFGRSVGTSCPLPDTWRGREEQLGRRTARDARDALRALAQAAAVDTARYLLIGVGPTASMAVEAAELDRHVGALLLISPDPAPVERGQMRARLAMLQLPAYFQLGPEDYAGADLSTELYRAGNRGASRIAEAHLAGTGPAQFRYDPAVGARFIRWLEGAMPPERGPRGPRRRSPRGG